MSEKIAAEIRNHGAIPFARFMELALYCPVYGYYEKEGDTVGRQGDYFTSVSVGSLFGELLAFQFSEWLAPASETIAKERRCFLVEAGAHRGDLARDVLTWIRNQRPALYERLDYWIIEPSPRRTQWQRGTLQNFEGRVRWAESLDAWARVRPMPENLGIIFSNELLDAFPVHRLGWDAKTGSWFEWGVGLAGEEFVWQRLPAPGRGVGEEESVTGLAGRRFETVMRADLLPDGFTLDLCPEAARWWGKAAHLLPAGKLLTFDYGLREEELLAPGREKGTLRAYSRHQPSSDALAHPGEQDLTAHVDFSVILEAGEKAGLRTESLRSQASFLTAIASRTWQEPAGFGAWTPQRRRQFQTLTHPDHLGRAFQVLIQSRP